MAAVATITAAGWAVTGVAMAAATEVTAATVGAGRMRGAKTAGGATAFRLAAKPACPCRAPRARSAARSTARMRSSARSAAHRKRRPRAALAARCSMRPRASARNAGPPSRRRERDRRPASGRPPADWPARSEARPSKPEAACAAAFALRVRIDAIESRRAPGAEASRHSARRCHIRDGNRNRRRNRNRNRNRNRRRRCRRRRRRRCRWRWRCNRNRSHGAHTCRYARAPARRRTTRTLHSHDGAPMPRKCRWRVRAMRAGPQPLPDASNRPAIPAPGAPNEQRPFASTRRGGKSRRTRIGSHSSSNRPVRFMLATCRRECAPRAAFIPPTDRADHAAIAPASLRERTPCIAASSRHAIFISRIVPLD